jgi:hypothetical protein
MHQMPHPERTVSSMTFAMLDVRRPHYKDHRSTEAINQINPKGIANAEWTNKIIETKAVTTV